MLDRSDLLDAKHLRCRGMFYYQSIQPCVYNESTFGHNCGTDKYFTEQRAMRSGYRNSRAGVVGGGVGGGTSLPSLSW